MNTLNVEISNIEKEKYIHYFDCNRDSDIVLIQAGYKEPHSFTYMGPAIRDHYLIHFVCSGRGEMWLQDRTYIVEENQCFLINPYEISYYLPHNGVKWEYYWIGVSGKRIEEFLEEIGFSKERRVLGFEDVFIYELIQTMLKQSIEKVEDESFYCLQINAQLREIMYRLIQMQYAKKIKNILPKYENHSDLLGRGRYNNSYVQTVSMTIQNSYKEDICVESIANMLNLNRSYLSTLFKKSTGKSIGEYLLYYRINKAKVHLQEEKYSIGEIAYLVGFRDPLYFSRVFKKYYDMSPQAYRKKYINS